MSGDTTFPPFNTSYQPSITEPLNPAWKLGDGLLPTPLGKEWVEDGLQGWKSWDMVTTPPKDTYNLLKSAVVPRPLALVSSLSAGGEPNLAIFSFFNVVSSNPPILSISFTHGRGPPKDTSENIIATREFVVNLVSEPFVQAANASTISAPMGFDEWKLAGLTMQPSVSVGPARVQESAVSFECEVIPQHMSVSGHGITEVVLQLYDYQHIYPDDDPKTPSATLLLGRVRHAHVRRAVLQADELQVDSTKCKMVSRVAGTMYGRMGDALDLKILTWVGWCKEGAERTGEELEVDSTCKEPDVG